MPLFDFVSKPNQRVAYLFPEVSFGNNPTSQTSPSGGFVPDGQTIRDVFVFQFWPDQVQDNYTPNWSTKNIPGGSHPIYQWTSGSGRDISFNAQFVSEIAENNGLLTDQTADFQSRIQRSTAQTPFQQIGGAALLGPLLLPSSRYNVNVSAAIAALQQYLYPDYVDNEQSGRYAKPPRKLVLVLPGTNLGRSVGDDAILCIMRSASVTMESFFPSGQLRAATVSLKFSEIVQQSSGDGQASNIKYIGARSYQELARLYTTDQTNPSEIAISS